MKVSFFSNYLTHHQIPFCMEMQKLGNIEFHFVSTQPMEEERKTGGWALDEQYSFELKAYESEQSKQRALQLAEVSDVVIVGSAPEEYVAYRMKHAKVKLTLRYSERIYKGGRWRVLSPRGVWNRFNTYFRYLGKPLYMLCASAYTAGDVAMLGSYIGRCFKWGYFPQNYSYDVERLLSEKKPNSILWVARMIDWKHPEIPIMVAKCLKEKGYEFHLNMIGDGPMRGKMQDLIEQYGLSDCVHLLGTMSPDEVRRHMEKSKFFLFTSDRHEGWGAVLNEAMNSACAVVANDEIGSVPFLLTDGHNGYSYHGNHAERICQRIEKLLDDNALCTALGRNAYKTITEQWSASIAAQRLVTICKQLLNGEKTFFEDGPCSKAKIRVKKG